MDKVSDSSSEYRRVEGVDILFPKAEGAKVRSFTILNHVMGYETRAYVIYHLGHFPGSKRCLDNRQVKLKYLVHPLLAATCS